MPYRDENESLRAEVERLRAQLARRQGAGRLWLGLGLVAADFAAAMMLRPWLNGGDDLHFWAALGLVVALAAAATWSAVR